MFVTQTVGCMALATETRNAKIAAIAIDLLIKLMKVGAVHGTFPLTKDQASLCLFLSFNMFFVHHLLDDTTQT